MQQSWSQAQRPTGNAEGATEEHHHMTSYEIMRAALALLMHVTNPNNPHCLDDLHKWQDFLRSKYAEQCEMDRNCSLWLEHGDLMCRPL